jgi:Transposase DDE domain group 1
MIRFRALLIAAGSEEAHDCAARRVDPVVKMAVGPQLPPKGDLRWSPWSAAPESAADLGSQPTMCRLENLPGAIDLQPMMAAILELFCDSFVQVPQRIVRDIDDTEDRVHGGQQRALFHAHYDSRCFLPIHIDAATG